MKSYVEEAYNLAKEAGYEGRLYASKHGSEFLDVRYWKSLSKALGLERKTGKMKWKSYNYNTMTYDETVIEEWKRHMHLFIDHLSEDKSVNDFFGSLISTRK